jgi:hypothetical protein
VRRYSPRVRSSDLSHDQLLALRRRLERIDRFLGKLILRCRELEMYEDDPLLHAILMAKARIEDVQREAMRAGLRHGALKDLDGVKAGEMRRA